MSVTKKEAIQDCGMAEILSIGKRTYAIARGTVSKGYAVYRLDRGSWRVIANAMAGIQEAYDFILAEVSKRQMVSDMMKWVEGRKAGK